MDDDATDEVCAKRFTAAPVHVCVCVLGKKYHLRNSVLSITFSVCPHTHTHASTAPEGVFERKPSLSVISGERKNREKTLQREKSAVNKSWFLVELSVPEACYRH